MVSLNWFDCYNYYFLNFTYYLSIGSSIVLWLDWDIISLLMKVVQVLFLDKQGTSKGMIQGWLRPVPPYFAKSDETICKVYSFIGKEKKSFYSIDFNTALILKGSLVLQHLGSVREYMKKLVYNRWYSNSLWRKQSVINSYFKCSHYFILMVGFNYKRHKGDYCTFFFPWWHNEVKTHKYWRTVKLLHI